MAKVRFRDVKQGRRPSTETKQRAKKPLHSIRNATLKERFKAFITDSFMLLMPIMYIVFYLIFDGREGFAAHKLLGWLYILIPYVAITTIFIVKTGQTPGMRAYEIRVVDIASGETPPAGAVLLRQILAVWDFFLFTWVLQFFRKDHRTLHEMLSGTALIHASAPTQKAAR
ncbi:RDD family protein [Nitratifractor sp.]